MKENKMNKESVRLLEKLGFEKVGGSFFTAPLSEEDNKNILDNLKPDHFTPNGHRSIFFGHMYPNTEKEFWYATSDVRGTFRGYRCRNEYDGYDTGNIFASAKTLLKCTEKFIKNYTDLKYNHGIGGDEK